MKKSNKSIIIYTCYVIIKVDRIFNKNNCNNNNDEDKTTMKIKV